MKANVNMFSSRRHHRVSAPVAAVGGPAGAHRVRVVLGQPGRGDLVGAEEAPRPLAARRRRLHPPDNHDDLLAPAPQQVNLTESGNPEFCHILKIMTLFPILFRGTAKLMALLPASMGLLLLYWDENTSVSNVTPQYLNYKETFLHYFTEWSIWSES